MSSTVRGADEDKRFIGGLWRELSQLSDWRCLFLTLCQEGFACCFVVEGVCLSGMWLFAAGLKKCSLSLLSSSSLSRTKGAAFSTSLTNFCLPTRDQKHVQSVIIITFKNSLLQCKCNVKLTYKSEVLMFWIHQFSSVLAFVSYLFPTGLQPENETIHVFMRCQTALQLQHLTYK